MCLQNAEIALRLAHPGEVALVRLVAVAARVFAATARAFDTLGNYLGWH